MVRTTRIAASVAAVAAAALVGGCSSSTTQSQTQSTAPTLAAAALQQNLTDRLTKDGDPPASVTCAGELAGTVGASATCAVVTSQNSSVEAVLNVTAVNGDTIDYDVMPRLSRDELEKAVKALTSADSVACDGGIEGRTGQIADCTTTKGGTPTQQIVGVGIVDGLKVDLTVN